MSFPAVFNVDTSLTGVNGFKFISTDPSGNFGWSVAPAGDFNGDGLPDLIVGARNAYNYNGTAYIIYGSSNLPLNTTIVTSALTGTNGFQLITNMATGNFGQSVASAGDFNGDGIDDVVVGASSWASGGAGAVYIIYGSRDVFSNPFNVDTALNGTNGFKLTTSVMGGAFGQSVASAGDFNGDGKDDIIVGANTASSNAGAAYVIYGSSTAFANPFNVDSDLAGFNGFKLVTSIADGWFGTSVASTGDFNLDGRADVIVGAFEASLDAGSAYIIYGSSTAFANPFNVDADLTGTNGFKLITSAADRWFGYSVASVGDFNGDGKADVAVGAAYWNSPDAGVAYIIYGSSNAFTNPFNVDTALTGANGFKLITSVTGGQFGSSVASAGDFNSDGAADIAVGAPGAGATYVVYGNSNAFTNPFNVDTNLTGTNGFKLITNIGGGVFGNSVASAGDFNRDGKADLVVGSPGANAGSGSAYVIYAESPATLPLACWTNPFPAVVNVDTALTGENGFQLTPSFRPSEAFGFSVSSAGDFNGDGWVDIVVGAPYAYNNNGTVYVIFGNRSAFAGTFNIDAALNGNDGFQLTTSVSGGYFGVSVALAGDFNGDGNSDLVIGAAYWTALTGAAYVIYGSSNAFSNPFNVDTALNGNNGFKFTTSVGGSSFGFSVASAGDFNGDGKADLVIGARFASAAYIIYGSGASFANPFNVDIALNGANGFKINTTAYVDFGISVASAGDFNGDGMSDVVIGADWSNSSAGAAYIIYGSSFALANPFNVDIDLTGTNGFKLIASGGGAFGGSVASVGDFNGDGKSDVIVGAPYASSKAGAAYVIYGSGGTFANPFNADVSLNGVNGLKLTSSVIGGQFGWSVASAGDFNDDGKSDVVIGAACWPAACIGSAYIVHGGGVFANPFDVNTALIGINGFRVNTSVANGNFGWSVASAGDFNRDGKADVIVGAYNASSGTGAAYTIYGQSPTQVTCSNTLSRTSTHTSTYSRSLTLTRSRTETSSHSTYSLTHSVSASHSPTIKLLDGPLAPAQIPNLSPAQVPTVVPSQVSDAAPAQVPAIIPVQAPALSPAQVPDLAPKCDVGFFPGTFDISNLNGVNGFNITGAGLGFGASVATVDVNGDGKDDVVIVSSSSGAAYVVFGGPAFLSRFSALDLDGTNGFMIYGAYVQSASGAGDINGDGRQDLVVGAPYENAGAGAAYVVFGASHYPHPLNVSTLNGTNGFAINGIAGGQFGWSAAGAGDVNGDGRQDLIVGAYRVNCGWWGCNGEVYVVFGASAFPAMLGAVNLTGTTGLTINVGNGYWMGWKVAGAGDVNGDGIDDLAISTGFCSSSASCVGGSTAYLVFGRYNFSGPLNVQSSSGVVTLTGYTGGVNGFGYLIAGAGDVNGDGKQDVIIGAWTQAAYVVFGANSFPATLDVSTLNGTNGFAIRTDPSGYRMHPVAKAGDINGDGLDDLMIADFAGVNVGYVVFGRTTFPSTLNISASDGLNAFMIKFIFEGAAGYWWSESSIVSAGDVNGDGVSDLVFGASYVNAAYVIFCAKQPALALSPAQVPVTSAVQVPTLSPAHLPAAAPWLVPDASPQQVSSIYPAQVPAESPAQVPDDSIAQVPVKYPAQVPVLSPSQISALSPKQVPDVSLGQIPDLGPSQLPLLSPPPPPPTRCAPPLFPSLFNVDHSLNGHNGFKLTADSAIWLGYSVASAGDFNGDGKSDLVIGAPYANAEGGAAYVIYGSATFTNPFNIATLNGTNGFKITADAAVDGLGISVASAGDFNGDGKADLIIGSSSNVAYVIYGSSSPLPNSFSVDEFLNGTNGFKLTTSTAMWFGLSVAPAGDFNQDGKSDIVIGAHASKSFGALASAKGKGGAYIVYGSSSAFAHPFNVDTQLHGTNGFKLVSNVAGDGFGFSVASAGDFNGDSYRDVIIGTRAVGASGAAYVIYGGPSSAFAQASSYNPFNVETSLNGTNGFELTTSATNTMFGYDVASAGDFNGDGKSDIIIGEFAANSNTGAAYVVYGSSSTFQHPFNVNALLNGTNGFQLVASVPNSAFGYFVSSAGDFNGDGVDDVLIGASWENVHTGAAYMVYGRGNASVFAHPFDVAGLNGTDGFRMVGSGGGSFGGSLAGVGDFNGDGVGDVVIGAWAAGGGVGASYLVLGPAC